MSRSEAPELPDWLAAMLPYQRYRLDVGGRSMHVMEHGEGRPVLLMHGNPTWGFLYRRVVAELEGEPMRLIMPDLIGLGLSDKPREAGAHTLDAHIGWLGALIDALGLEDVLLVLQDWGGPIGIGAFVERRERLSGLVVMNTVLGAPKPGFRPTSFHRFSRFPVVSDLVFRGFGFPQRGMSLAQGDRESVRGEVARAYRWPLRRFRDRVAPLALARMVPDSMEHPSIEPLRRVQALVESFEGPAAIVWGDRDPVLGRLRRRTQRMLPNAPVTETDAGHFLQEEVPEAIAEAIREVASAARGS